MHALVQYSLIAIAIVVMIYLIQSTLIVLAAGLLGAGVYLIGKQIQEALPWKR